MFLENVVFDAIAPRSAGRFWEALLGTDQLTDEPAGYETRLAVPGGPVLDLCFQRVGEPPVGPRRLQLAVRVGAPEPLVDPEGNPFRVVGEDAAYAGAGPLAALELEVADPARDRDFWAWLTGWQPVEGTTQTALRHASGRGPLLELHPESEPKGPGKNRIHLDIRLEPGDDVEATAAEIAARGGRELHFDWGELPWRHFADPSGNELCLLPAPRG